MSAVPVTEQPVTVDVTEAEPKQETAVDTIPVPLELAMQDRIGITAGDIWHYLNNHGATAVDQIVQEISEEEAIIQRSIGWLAQEDKILLEIIDDVESIRLKN